MHVEHYLPLSSRTPTATLSLPPLSTHDASGSTQRCVHALPSRLKPLRKRSGSSATGFVFVTFLTLSTSQVLNAAAVIAQERAQKRTLIQNLKTGAGLGFVAQVGCLLTPVTGLATDPARQRALLQPFVEEARVLGLTHDIVDAAQAKLKVCSQRQYQCTAMRIANHVDAQLPNRHLLTRKRSPLPSYKRLSCNY
jgi:hypothetical protein